MVCEVVLTNKKSFSQLNMVIKNKLKSPVDKVEF